MRLVLETGTGLVAVFAVNGAVAIGTERHEGRLAAIGTYCFEHFTGLTIIAALVFALSAAVWATRGLVDESATGVEFLLTGSEDKLGTTFTAVQGLVLIH